MRGDIGEPIAIAVKQDARTPITHRLKSRPKPIIEPVSIDPSDPIFGRRSHLPRLRVDTRLDPRHDPLTIDASAGAISGPRGAT